MGMRLAVLLAFVVLTGCGGEAITLRHPKIGDSVVCQPAGSKLLGKEAEECAESYERAGWVREQK